MRQFNKVFGIGLPKTGTTSLIKAMRRLKFKFGRIAKYPDVVESLARGEFSLEKIDEQDGVADVPIPTFFEDFLDAYPNSICVHTVRDRDSWLRSCENHWRNHSYNNRYEVRKRPSLYHRLATWGCLEFNASRFSRVYDLHEHRVSQYFARHPERLLVLNVSEGHGWERLCPFLGVSVPDEPFPHVNKGDYE